MAALTSRAPVPPGFDERLVGVARRALLRKRAGEVARQWPLLAAGHGPQWNAVFARWAADRPTNGSLRDGWDLARDLRNGAHPAGDLRDGGTPARELRNGRSPARDLRGGGRPARELRDGADRVREPAPGLPALAEAELAAREAEWRYDGTTAPRRRRGPAVRWVGRALAVQVAGRVRVRVGRS